MDTQKQVTDCDGIDYAEAYLANEWSVIPLLTRDKRPALPWTAYQKTRPTQEEIQSWFGSGTHNIGIVTGSISDLSVLDCDSMAAVALAESFGLPPTWTVQTGKGRHYYFRYRDGARNFQKRDDLPGIDLRAEGGYVVAPPSIHPSGAQYTWLVNSGELAELPHWVLATKPHHKTPFPVLYAEQPPGMRNLSLARLAGKWVKLGIEDALYIAQLWNAQHSPPLPWKEVSRTIHSIWVAEQRKQERVAMTYGGSDE